MGGGYLDYIINILRITTRLLYNKDYREGRREGVVTYAFHSTATIIRRTYSIGYTPNMQ